MKVEIRVESGEIDILVDDSLVHNETTSAWDDKDLYFKQGIYCTGSTSAIGIATNEVRSLSLVVDEPIADIVSITGIVAHGETITITDTLERFGAKPAYHKQLFIESATAVYEDNVLNNTHVGLEAGDWVPCVSTGNNPPNGGVAGAVFQGAFAQVSNVQRHPRVSSCFSGQAIQIPGATAEPGQLTWPTMFGANRDTPYGEYFRASWWLWIGHKNCRKIKYTSFTGVFDTGSNTATSAFDQGEALSLSNGATAYVVWVDTENSFIYMNMTGGDQGQAAINGLTVTGITSGATCVLDTTTGYGGGGSQKPWRVYEESTMEPAGRKHTRMFASASLGQWAIDGWNGSSGTRVPSSGIHQLPAIPTRQWVKVKTWHDYRGTNLVCGCSINGQIITNSELVKALVKSATHGPTLANWGYEASVNNYDCALFGELDACTSPLEVEIGDAPVYEDCTQQPEACRIVSWSAGEIQIDVNQGGLDNLTGKYLFIRNESGELFGGGIPLEAT